MPIPPVTSRVCPVMYEEVGEAKNSIPFAASSGVPFRARGLCNCLWQALLNFLALDFNRIVVVKGTSHPRVDHSEGHSICPNAKRPPLSSERLRQTDDAGFGRRIVRLADIAMQPRSGRNIYDASILRRPVLVYFALCSCTHVWSCCTCNAKGRGKVAIQDGLPLRIAHLVQHSIP
eukprot:6010874-Pleurochrysis_carterae.AAC.2